jgi:hypothetical protein
MLLVDPAQPGAACNWRGHTRPNAHHWSFSCAGGRCLSPGPPQRIQIISICAPWRWRPHLLSITFVGREAAMHK